MHVAVVIGSALRETASGAPALPISDRGAVALARARFAGDVRAYARDPAARWFARAAGIESVEEALDPEIGSFDVALIGRGGCGAAGDALPARLAEATAAALVYAVIDVQCESDRLLVTRDLGRGARDVLGVRGCAVLVFSDNVARGPYVSRYRIHAARAASRESPAREQPRDLGWDPVTPRVRLGDLASRFEGSAVQRMNALFGVGGVAKDSANLVRGSAEECARQLLRYLGHHGFIERESAGALQGMTESASTSPFAERKTEADQRATRSAVASQPGQPRPERTTAGAASIPTRARRRPLPVDGRPCALRGPFEIGVDV